MHESFLKYLSGLVDTDGHLALTKNGCRSDDDKFWLRLQLQLSSSENIDRHGFIKSLPELTGMGGVHQCPQHSQMHTWTVSEMSDLEKLLPRLIKHMSIKAKHWQQLLDIRRSYKGKALTRAGCDELLFQSKRSRIENVGPIKPKNHPSWSWMAGFMDGDGHFYCRENKKGSLDMYAGATVHKNDESVLYWVQKAFGGKIYEHSKNAQAMRWRRPLGFKYSSFALDFLPKLAKHSRLKKHKIDKMIHIHSQRLSTRRATA